MTQENYQIAEAVLAHIGGPENVKTVMHCATRLRLILNDESKVDTDAIEDLDKVKGAFFNSGQYQIIFGTGTVNKIYDEFVKLDNFDAKDLTKTDNQPSADAEVKQTSVKEKMQRAFRTFGDVFVPIIPVLVATGLFMGVRGLVTQPAILALFGMTTKSLDANFLMYTQILTDTAFAFLPALIAWSAFRVFGGSPVIGIVLGLMLVNPALPNAYAVGNGTAKAIEVFGFIPLVGYQGSVLPAFISGFLGAKLEQWLRKRVPESLDLLLTPFLTLLVMSLAALFAIGPVFHSVEQGILAGTQAVLHLPFGLAGIIIGGLQQVIVITGVHHVFNMLEIQLLADTGRDQFNAIITSAIVAQAAATFAVGFKTKKAKLKTLAFSSGISGMLGITEPAIFGVNLRFGKPFLMGLVGGAAGGFVASLFDLGGTGMAITALPGILLYLNSQLPWYLLSMVVAFGVSFALTYLFGYSDKEEETLVKEDKLAADGLEDTVADAVFAPVAGEVVALADVKDPVFNSGAMGDGFAVKPSAGQLVAPFDGIIRIAFPTGHAIGMASENGAEVLMHIGIDTVGMNGDGFTVHVGQGQKVKRGDLLVEFDSAKIAAAGLEDTTMVVVTNTDDFEPFSVANSGHVEVGDLMIDLEKKA